MAEIKQSALVDGSEPSNKLTVIQELYSKLTEIKDKIKEGGLSQTIFDELSSQAKIIQDKLNALLSSRKILTQSDVNDAYKTLQDVQRQELERMKRISNKNLVIYVGVGVLALFGVMYLFKKK